jgi:YidC/Oxa1 family membrane protein insertase
MFDRNTIIGITLSIAFFIAFVIQSQNKSQKEQLIQRTAFVADSIKSFKEKSIQKPQSPVLTASVASPVAVNDSSAKEQLVEKFGAFSSNTSNVVKDITIENEVMKLTVSTKGAVLKSIELKKFKTWDQKPLILTINADNKTSLGFNIKNAYILSDELIYETDASAPIVVSGNEQKSISLKVKASATEYFEQIYTLKGNSFLLDYNINFVNLNNIIPAGATDLTLKWNQTTREIEKSIDNERRYSGIYYQYQNGDVEELTGVKNEEISNLTTIKWISFKQQFFNMTLLYKDGMSPKKISTVVDPKDKSYTKKYAAELKLTLPSPNSKLSFQYYFGPNDYNALKKMENGMQHIMPLASTWKIFSWMGFVNEYGIIPLFNVLKNFTTNYGIVIFIIALLIKLILTPFTIQQTRQSMVMQIMKPDLDKLKDKYKDDPTKFSAEQMKLMSKVGASPLSGCLPMLLQMPILIAMYNFFPASIDLRQAHFLWANDLSTYDAIWAFKPILFGIDHISLFTVLMTITSLANAFITPQPAQQDNPAMKYMPYFFPIMLLFMFNNFPAALTYYYLLFNLFSIIQTYLIKKIYFNEDKLREEIADKKTKEPKKGGWMQKIEDMQKQQQAQLAAQNNKKKK